MRENRYNIWKVSTGKGTLPVRQERITRTKTVESRTSLLMVLFSYSYESSYQKYSSELRTAALKPKIALLLPDDN